MVFTDKFNAFRGKLGTFFVEKRKRILLWLFVALVCGCGCCLTWFMGHYNLPWSSSVQYYHATWNPHVSIPETLTLEPGQTAEQTFRAMGNVVGSCNELYLEVEEEQQTPFHLSVCLSNADTGEIIMQTQTVIRQAPEEGTVAVAFPEPVILSSGKDYCLRITNSGETGNVLLCADGAVESGTLELGGERIDAMLDFGVFRTSMYTPSRLLPLMLVLTCLTVLGGLALVLFTNVKEHILYLVLAMGFGIVTLFDLTPLYGFDMRFQFDGVYVVSNELMGMEGVIYAPSKEDPEKDVVHYYRRACDDYTQFQFYHDTCVSDNYVDTAAGLRSPRADQADQELVLVEANQGIVSEQLYVLNLPQAIGFTIARLLGLGFIPMVQMGRIVSYGVFVLLMFFAIRMVPFGKRMFLILALTPAVLTQTVSITRDAVIFGLSFFLIAKVLQTAYSERKPSVWDWLVILLFSVLLAPCKAVYLPVSFFCLLVVYRQYIRGQKVRWGRILLVGVCALILILFVLDRFSGLFWMLENAFAQARDGSGVPEVYTIAYTLTHPSLTVMVFLNTMRTQLGSLLVNGIQLFDINLGSSDTMTILILFLLLIECWHEAEKRDFLRPGERVFCFLVAFAVLVSTALAALTWTDTDSYVIMGIQGRYLTPVFPLLCVCLMNNHRLRIRGNHQTLVKAGCCIFPAIYLMNMYLWTILQ
ncbi:MAG: DUF2142 domain-containing protein [Faecousia sp.]